MNLVIVLIDVDNQVINAYGPFESSHTIVKWVERYLRSVEYHRYEIVRLVSVTEDKE